MSTHDKWYFHLLMTLYSTFPMSLSPGFPVVLSIQQWWPRHHQLDQSTTVASLATLQFILQEGMHQHVMVRMEYHNYTPPFLMAMLKQMEKFHRNSNPASPNTPVSNMAGKCQENPVLLLCTMFPWINTWTFSFPSWSLKTWCIKKVCPPFWHPADPIS